MLRDSGRNHFAAVRLEIIIRCGMELFGARGSRISCIVARMDRLITYQCDKAPVNKLSQGFNTRKPHRRVSAAHPSLALQFYYATMPFSHKIGC